MKLNKLLKFLTILCLLAMSSERMKSKCKEASVKIVSKLGNGAKSVVYSATISGIEGETFALRKPKGSRNLTKEYREELALINNICNFNEIVFKVLDDKSADGSEKFNEQQGSILEKVKKFDEAQKECPVSMIFGRTENYSALLMKRYKGSLLDFFKSYQTKKTFDLALFQKISLKLAATLNKLHDKGYVHNDFKEENILYNGDLETDSEPVLVLTDLEYTCLLKTDKCKKENHHTILYTNINSLESNSNSFKTDTYALGLIFINFIDLRIIPSIQEKNNFLDFNENAKNLLFCSLADKPPALASLIKKILGIDKPSITLEEIIQELENINTQNSKDMPSESSVSCELDLNAFAINLNDYGINYEGGTNLEQGSNQISNEDLMAALRELDSYSSDSAENSLERSPSLFNMNPLITSHISKTLANNRQNSLGNLKMTCTGKNRRCCFANNRSKCSFSSLSSIKKSKKTKLLKILKQQAQRAVVRLH